MWDKLFCIYILTFKLLLIKDSKTLKYSKNIRYESKEKIIYGNMAFFKI